MRIVVHRYADGDMFAAETATDGRVAIKDLLGQRRPGARLSAYLDVACDDNDKGFERLEESLKYLLEEVRRRRSQPAAV